MRIFHGIDLDKNYASMMWNTHEPKARRELAIKRQFRGFCLRLEREMKTGMYVIDREKKIYQIIDIKGWGIEEKEYWLQRFTTLNMEKKTAMDIYPLDWWIREKKSCTRAGETQPLWFMVGDVIRERESKWTK